MGDRHTGIRKIAMDKKMIHNKAGLSHPCSANDLFLSGSGLECGNCGASDYEPVKEPIFPWVIFNKQNSLFWSNFDGWVDYWICTRFTEKEKDEYYFNLPIGGVWVRRP
jgi:hypothetical protein